MALSKKVPVMAALLGICCGAALTIPAQAQHAHFGEKAAPAADSGLPNFDIRYTPDGEPTQPVLNALAKHPKTAENLAAVDRLRGRVPFLTIDTDAALGTPHFVRSWAHFLTDENPGVAPTKVVQNFVADNAALFEIDPAEIPAARIARNYTDDHNGVTHLTLQQQIGGIDLFLAEVKANTDRSGRLVNISSTMLPRPAGDFQPAAATMTDLEAIRAGAASVGVEVCDNPTPAESPQGASLKRRWNNSPDFRADQAIVTERLFFPVTRDDIRPAWYVLIPTRGVGHTYRLVIDAIDGTVLYRFNELCSDVGSVTMRVYTGRSSTPGPTNTTNYHYPYASRTLVTADPTPPGPNSPSPFGWLDTNGVAGADSVFTIGNNVDAHLDRISDNVADTNGRPNGGASAIFDLSQDNGTDPSNWGLAAVTQAFYYTNFYHDRLYALGFTEAAGNFQTNNYGRGGLANDPVQMDCQDGGGTNNANFGTPTDGGSGRCQMYVWTAANPDRDGDLDAEVLYHELTHGLSNRLAVLSSPQGTGMGEGWSDFVGCCLLSVPGEDPNGVYCTGAYSTNNYTFGVRRFPYTTNMVGSSSTANPLTWDAYGTTGTTSYGVNRSTEVHNTGEIWCMSLWECRAALYQAYGYAANNLILQLVVDGLKDAPSGPTFSQCRDAILQADLTNNGGANQRLLWGAFAKRGLGLSFSTPGSTSTTITTLGFDVPTVFTEGSDAGDLPATATIVRGSGSLPSISGTLAVINDVDIYRISICDRTTFSATTVGGATFNTQLFLFDLNGNAVTFNDDASATTQSTINGTFVPSNAEYYLAISASDRDPISNTGEIWLDAPLTTQRQPDGPGSGAGHPITGWTGTGNAGTPGAYTITLTGACASAGNALAPEPRALTAWGAPSPTPNYIGDTTLKSLIVYVIPATLPISTGVTVSLNASSIGMGTIALLKNASPLGPPDASGVFSAQRSLAALAVGDYYLPYTVTDPSVIPNRVYNDTMIITIVDPIVTCCTSTKTCLVQLRSTCVAAAGTVLGDNIPCSIHPCVPIPGAEPNDTIAQATNASSAFSIYAGNLYHMGITGDMSPDPDADYFNIGALQVGDVLTISESGINGLGGTNADTYVRLYRNGASGVVASDDDGGPSIDSLLWRFPIAIADTYFVRGSGWLTTNTGTYRLGIFLENSGTTPGTGASPALTAEIEPNETKGAAADDASTSWRKVQYLSINSGAISSTTDKDIYAFTFTAGDVISLNVFSGTGLDAKVNLLDSAGANIILENGGSTGPLGDSPLYAYNIPSTGTYFLQVMSTNSGTSGPYLFALYLSTTTPPTLYCLADFNYDGTRNVADIFSFLAAWFAGDPRADVDGNGNGTPVVADIFTFLSHWFSGC